MPQTAELTRSLADSAGPTNDPLDSTFCTSNTTSRSSMASTALPTDTVLLDPETKATAPETASGKEGGGYSAENITVLEGLAAVRLRPAMYIGSTGEQGLHHLVYEVVDNSVDEALGGHATKIDVTIQDRKSVV